MYDKDDSVQIAVTYELNRETKIMRRKVYGFLDILADLGGLTVSLYSIFSVAVIVV